MVPVLRSGAVAQAAVGGWDGVLVTVTVAVACKLGTARLTART